MHETETGYVIDVKLPGIDKKDIKVEVKNDILTLYGERKEERKTKEKGYQSVEPYYGKFEQTFGLPYTVKAENITTKIQ